MTPEQLAAITDALDARDAKFRGRIIALESAIEAALIVLQPFDRTGAWETQEVWKRRYRQKVEAAREILERVS